MPKGDTPLAVLDAITHQFVELKNNMVKGQILGSNDLAAIKTDLGEDVIIYHMPRYNLQALAEQGIVDAIIVDSEDGFSQLGQMRGFLSTDLGIPERNLVKHVLDGFPSVLENNISSLADWNRFESSDVTLIAIPSSRQESLLKGAVLSPYECCKCYRKYAVPEYGKPYRDFFYNVTFEAISYAYKVWGARKIGLAHLGSYRRTKHREDITKCQIEAIVHFCNENTGLECFTLVSDYWTNSPLEVVRQFDNMKNVGFHRAINTRIEEKLGIEFTHIDLGINPQ